MADEAEKASHNSAATHTVLAHRSGTWQPWGFDAPYLVGRRSSGQGRPDPDGAVGWRKNQRGVRGRARWAGPAPNINMLL